MLAERQQPVTDHLVSPTQEKLDVPASNPWSGTDDWASTADPEEVSTGAAVARILSGMGMAIEVSHLHVKRGRRMILEDFDARMEQGRITGLLGPSGSGKTTLMRCLVGVQKIQSGTIRILGLDAGTASLRRRVAYVTQAASVYKDLTVEQNVRHFGSLVGAPKHRVGEVLEMVGLTEVARHLGSQLSGGQLSRTSLACALVGDPEVLVLDEPTVGQDPVLRDDLWQHFRERANAGATIVVSSHVMDEASRCDDILLMREGQLLAACTPGELLDRTGTDDLDEAFLALCRKEHVA